MPRHTSTASIALALCAALNTVAVTPAMAHSVTLGDGHISASPRAGYLMSCKTSFSRFGPGASVDGPWIGDTTWDPSRKAVVDGSVTLPSRISITLDGATRSVRANGLPGHPTGTYPISRSDDAFRYDRNPNAIRAGNIVLSLPAMPSIAARPSCVPMGMIGFALSGAAIYNAVDERGRDAVAHEIQDACNGHPQQRGQYHYHSGSPCLTDTRSETGGHSDLVGYALDGFGLYGAYGENGRKLTNADLDACHGHVHEVMWNGKRTAIYHYHTTDAYPYTIGCFTGTPVRAPR